MTSVFPMRFVALVTLVTLVTLVSVVSPCYLVHQNGGFSRGTSYARDSLLIMQFRSRLLPLPTPKKSKRACCQSDPLSPNQERAVSSRGRVAQIHSHLLWP